MNATVNQKKGPIYLWLFRILDFFFEFLFQAWARRTPVRFPIDLYLHFYFFYLSWRWLVAVHVARTKIIRMVRFAVHAPSIYGSWVGRIGKEIWRCPCSVESDLARQPKLWQDAELDDSDFQKYWMFSTGRDLKKSNVPHVLSGERECFHFIFLMMATSRQGSNIWTFCIYFDNIWVGTRAINYVDFFFFFWHIL